MLFSFQKIVLRVSCNWQNIVGGGMPLALCSYSLSNDTDATNLHDKLKNLEIPLTTV